MVKVYVLLIKCGRRTVAQTPSIWYQDTVDELRKEGWFDEHPEQDPDLDKQVTADQSDKA